ncbi:hypothetical protein C8A00DRAFT_29736 [Chaetomidium leptoderma]|uniref:Uncharacterized protein n=1 Tax=Chaetomidium leptoderma TaxID=669021 RepID=A0AAN6ZZ22_9PEZI|nr:hypothetical protein C8A00DRAFT_29736 [Chaetomidium leptoderma]
MDGIHQSVKITDGMLRALVQRLSSQIDSMGASKSNEQLTNVAKQLAISLTQVQRVHEQLESSLARTLDHEHATKSAANQQKESAESALVTDKLSKLAAIFGSPVTGTAGDSGMGGGDKTLGRLEAKLDALTTKFEKIHQLGIAGLALRSEIQETWAKVEDAGRTGADRLTSIDKTLLEINDRIVAPTPSPSAAIENQHQAPSSEIVGRERKRKREDEDAGSGSSHPLQLSEDQRKKLQELARLRSVTAKVFDELVPCPDGGSWDAAVIFERFWPIFASHKGQLHATRLRQFVDRQQPQTWCCAWHAALSATNTVSSAGKCTGCPIWCVQVKLATTHEGTASRRYYVRVCPGRRQRYSELEEERRRENGMT